MFRFIGMNGAQSVLELVAHIWGRRGINMHEDVGIIFAFLLSLYYRICFMFTAYYQWYRNFFLVIVKEIPLCTICILNLIFIYESTQILYTADYITSLAKHFDTHQLNMNQKYNIFTPWIAWHTTSAIPTFAKCTWNQKGL